MKIKYLIDTILSPKIQVLDFVDRYAGIVRTINIAEGNGTETGIVKRYPLACNVTGVDCANIGIYQNLVPDDSKKSVIYWEMVSPMQNSGMTKTRDFYRKRFKGTARLVVWLNLAKLGIDNCTDSILVLPILEKEITTKGKITGGIYDGDLLWVEPLRMVNQDINTIFGKYDYNKLKNYYLYPFDFFAIDVQFTLEQCLSKGGTFPILPASDCVNEISGTIPPPPVVNMSLWLRGDIGVNGGTVANGDPVSIWADQSGKGNDFTQAVFVRQPTFLDAGVNGKSGISFTSPNILELIGTNLFLLNEGVIFIVCKKNGPALGFQYGAVLTLNASSYFSAGPSHMILSAFDILVGFPSNSYYFNMFKSSLELDFGLSGTSGTILTTKKTATSSEGKRDGVVVDTGTGAQTFVQTYNALGQWGVVGRTFEGEIYEVIIYEELISDADIIAVETYLKNKYNII